MASTGAAPAAKDQALTRKDNPSENTVQRTRAWTGMWVVIGGDIAIAAGAAFGAWKTGSAGNTGPMIAILTSAFTAISTMTTAYFGIKTMSNTAQSFAPAKTTVPAVQSVVSHVKDDLISADDSATPTPPTGAPIPKDPKNPTDDEIVARMEEPPTEAQ